MHSNRRQAAIRPSAAEFGVGRHEMSIPDLVEKVRSGVVHIEFHVGGTRVASGSGFMSRGLLVTNHHVFLGPGSSTVVLAWQPTQDPSSRVEVKLNYAAFASALVTGSDQNNHDFAVLKLAQLQNPGESACSAGLFARPCAIGLALPTR